MQDPMARLPCSGVPEVLTQHKINLEDVLTAVGNYHLICVNRQKRKEQRSHKPLHRERVLFVDEFNLIRFTKNGERFAVELSCIPMTISSIDNVRKGAPYVPTKHFNLSKVSSTSVAGLTRSVVRFKAAMSVLVVSSVNRTRCLPVNLCALSGVDIVVGML